MSNNDNNNMEDEDDQFNQAFGEHTGISEGWRRWIGCIKNNEARDIYNNEIINLGLGSDITALFNNDAWKLLGGYIAKNTHLKSIKICHCNDEQMVLLFSGLRRSSSLKRLELSNNEFGIEGVRSMIPFLENSPSISDIRFFNNFNTECFEALISALHNKGVERLQLENSPNTVCNIEDI